MAKSISHVQGKGSINHNNRTFKAKNVNAELTKNNITFVKMSIEKAYDDCFSAAVERYNEKQKRSDRKIKGSYYQYAFNRAPCNTVVTASDKRKSFYEDVVQIGTKDDTGIGTADAQIATECLTEYMNGFSDRNPNFFVFNAVLHVDEATPHLHIDYIPIGHYKRGVDTQNGLAQALKEMGYGDDKNAISRWREHERDILTEICRKHGIEISEPQEGRGHSFAVEEYKKYRDNITELENKLDELDGKILTQTEVNAINGKKTITGALKNVTYDQYLSLKKTAGDVWNVRAQNAKLKDEIKELQEQLKQQTEMTNEANNYISALQSPLSPQNIERRKQKNDMENQLRVLKDLVGISADNYNDLWRQLKERGLVPTKNSKKRII